MTPRALWQALNNWARALRRDGLTLWFALRHPGTPRPLRWLAVLVVAYALSPIDLIPDVIPVLGYLDDLLLLPGLIWLALRLLPAPVRAACKAQALEWLQQQRARPRSRLGLALVLALWAAMSWGLWVWLDPLHSAPA